MRALGIYQKGQKLQLNIVQSQAFKCGVKKCTTKFSSDLDAIHFYPIYMRPCTQIAIHIQ